MSSASKVYAVITILCTAILMGTVSASANHPPGPPMKMTICHKQGRPAEKTMTLPHKAAERHVARHGDTWGPCTEDRIIDADGTASTGDGIPGAVEVMVGDSLSSFPVAVPNDSGLDMFDNDGDAAWTFGPAGDDLHVEGPTFCATAIRDGDHDLGLDCKVLDLDGSLADQQPVDCDLEVGAFCTPPLPSPIKYHDGNGNGSWDDSEDIVLDVNNNGVFD